MTMDYKPRSYRQVSSARRAGRRICRKNGWSAFRVVTLDKIYLVCGKAELENFEKWVTNRQIPVSSKDVHLTLVYR